MVILLAVALVSTVAEPAVLPRPAVPDGSVLLVVRQPRSVSVTPGRLVGLCLKGMRVSVPVAAVMTACPVDAGKACTAVVAFKADRLLAYMPRLDPADPAEVTEPGAPCRAEETKDR